MGLMGMVGRKGQLLLVNGRKLPQSGAEPRGPPPPDQRIDLTEFGEAEGKEILLSLMCPSLSTFSPPDGPIRAPSSPPTKRPCRENLAGGGGFP